MDNRVVIAGARRVNGLNGNGKEYNKKLKKKHLCLDKYTTRECC